MQLIIFDFDGVVADSEWLANKTLAENLSKIGLATTVEDAMQTYMGRRWSDCVSLMEQRLGSALPEDFLAAQIEGHARLAPKIQAVVGVEAFLQRFSTTPRCIASSSGLDYIGKCLDRMALSPWFEHRFSGHDVERGKPHPDLFLKAAAAFGVSCADCVVIEDSAMGVTAGKAAGMMTIGLCAGSHIRDGHAQRLRDAGADRVVTSYDEVARLLEPLTA